MQIQLFTPKNPADGGVRAIFQTHGSPGFRNETIIPKGSTEIIFDLSEQHSIRASLGRQASRLPRCFIYSFTLKPIYIELPKQQTYFGVILHPTVINQLIGSPAGEFANQWVDLTLVDSAFQILWEQLAEKKDFSSRVSVITKWAASKIRSVDTRDEMLNTFLSNQFMYTATVPEVAEALCYSPRHLSRKLQGLTGMNTEEILHYKKYLRALTLMHHSSLPLTTIGHESHFSDQSHFIKSFRLFSNMTPGEYHSLKSASLPGHIFQNVR